jgi:hypothetical protein
MGVRFRVERGPWTRYRQLPGPVKEVDFHWSDIRGEWRPYDEKMAEVYETALEELLRAHKDGLRYLIFTHGSSTSRIGKTTARSVIRGLMRSATATPYILRAACIQHETVFVAAIRPQPKA